MLAVRGAREPRFSLRAVDGLGAKKLTTDSRRVEPGDTFVAYPGETRDGRRRPFSDAAAAQAALRVL